jgi:uncharacterized beta-barrel protein YwiB (DUF1934 family)
MTDRVLLTISGLQFVAEEDGANEAVEVITPGDYYKKNDKHYVVYDEVMEGFSGSTKNIIEVSDRHVDIIKSGVSSVNLAFEKDKKNVSHYYTPFGSLLIGIETKNIDVEEGVDNIDIKVNYDLEINHQFMANCDISMNIKAKDAKDFHLA